MAALPKLSQSQSHGGPLGVVGLGNIGLPLACLFPTKFRVGGFDIAEKRVQELSTGLDHTRKINDKSWLLNGNLRYTSEEEALADCPLIEVAVPARWIESTNRI